MPQQAVHRIDHVDENPLARMTALSGPERDLSGLFDEARFLLRARQRERRDFQFDHDDVV